MSTPFLQEIARHFAEVHGDELYKYRFFFPNRRSGVFFLHYLRTALGDRVALLPEATTVSEYLRRVLYLPEEDVNNDLFITFELCKVFNELSGEEERTFNDFYYLGNLILGDFNDLDKHLLPVDQIFRNVSDYQELNDDLSYLTDEQKEALRHFFGYRGFLNDPKLYQERFMRFWEMLPSLYHQTKERLSGQGLHYEGMLLRDVVERLESGALDLTADGKRPVFVGLNALTPCEKVIFDHFKEKGDALFYWDYVSDLLQSDTLSGAFRNNEKRYPMPDSESVDHIDFSPALGPLEQTIDLVALPSEVAQTVYIGEWLKDESLHAQIDELKVAVVLPSERLLIPLLSNIPSELPHLNVTMGYPIRELPAVSMLLRLLELRMLHRRRNHEWRGEEIREILGMNPLYEVLGEGNFGRKCVQILTDERWFFITSEEFLQLSGRVEPTPLQQELVQLLFGDSEDSGLRLLAWVTDLVQFLSQRLAAQEAEEQDEAVYSGASSVLPFVAELLEQQRVSAQRYAERHDEALDLVFGFDVVHDLLTTLLRQSRIPYRGEPLRGLQVMGILETRGLDFETIILPDAAEEILPAKTRLMGVIPYTIRQGLGLPTYKWQDQTRAYNFFRLISRAHRIVATFDTRRNDHSGGEPSRYLGLLEHVYGRRVHKVHANFPLRFDGSDAPDPEIDREAVKAFVDGITTGPYHLSASKIIRYLQCPRSFYYTTILRLEEHEEMEELISDRDMGTLVHDTLQHLYEPYEGKVLDRAHLQQILSEERGHGTIRRILKDVYAKLFRRHADNITGMNEIVVDTAEGLVRNVVRMDAEYPSDIHYIGGEVKMQFKEGIPEHSQTVNLKGYIDRLDYVVEEGQNVLRVIDYKTGRDKLEVNFEDKIDDNKEFNHAAFQVFFYSHYLSDNRVAHRTIAQSEKDYASFLPSVYSIRPMIIKPRISNAGLLTTKQGGELRDFGEIHQKYSPILHNALTEIVSTDNAFKTTPRSYSCLYCPARNFCKSAK